MASGARGLGVEPFTCPVTDCPLVAFTAQVEVLVSCNLVRAQGGSWLTSTCWQSTALGLCLPTQVCPWPTAGSPTMASGSRLSLSIGVTQGGQEPRGQTHPLALRSDPSSLSVLWDYPRCKASSPALKHPRTVVETHSLSANQPSLC